MRAPEDPQASPTAKFVTLFTHLNERQRRPLMGAEARALGHGGIRLVARAAGVREATVSAGVAEFGSDQVPLGRVRMISARSVVTIRSRRSGGITAKVDAH